MSDNPERDRRALERIDELQAQGYGVDEPVHLDWLEDQDEDVVEDVPVGVLDDDGTENDR